MNDPDTVLNARVHFIQRHHIFWIMVFDLHQVPDLAVGIFRQLHADLHIHPLVAAVGNKVDFLRVVLSDEHLITFPIFLRHAAFISRRRCFDHGNHALAVLESAYQKNAQRSCKNHHGHPQV